MYFLSFGAKEMKVPKKENSGASAVTSRDLRAAVGEPSSLTAFSVIVLSQLSLLQFIKIISCRSGRDFFLTLEKFL